MYKKSHKRILKSKCILAAASAPPSDASAPFTMDELNAAMAKLEVHGDLVEGSPLTIVSQKIRAGFEKYGLRRVGEKGEPFDPKLHEALVQLPSAEVTVNTVADVIEPGYALGERLIRAAKVAVSVPE